ncbi:hypothetical protein KIPB_006481 [Kipferlia bialata]|uniref:Uncharacterized protein n=1 Tax=Kipferlia bialata TaxID=797122 RepID=A0A9K3GI72_9EUKA|nr:hypothetical protein KIPB_006481 [Kipferlia bialata]|eukprot:g6481.t1
MPRSDSMESLSLSKMTMMGRNGTQSVRGDPRPREDRSSRGDGLSAEDRMLAQSVGLAMKALKNQQHSSASDLDSHHIKERHKRKSRSRRSGAGHSRKHRHRESSSSQAQAANNDIWGGE